MVKDPYKYFRIEAPELLQGLGQGVLDLEKGAVDKELVGKLLRLAHTLKGASRVVKQPLIAEKAHAFEDTLAPFRDGARAVARASTDELFRLLDAMAALLLLLDRPLDAEGVSPSVAPGAVEVPRPEQPFATVRVELGETDLLLQGIAETSVRVTALRQELEAPDRLFGRLCGLARVLAIQLGARSGTETLPASEASGLLKAEERAAAILAAAHAHSIAGELSGGLERLRRSLARDVDRAEQELRDVAETANQLRLLPGSTVFPSLERAARDAAQSEDKQIEFSASGGEHRLDGHVLLALRDALFHVVRNAVAHGIEAPAERALAGKPPVGHVRLEVSRRGNKVAFTCDDDGRGIDVEAVRHAAVTTGAISKAESALLGGDEAIRLILKAGVTTAGKLTELSGRGIGLDVLRETVSRLSGEIRVRSVPSRGTTVEVVVPVSLSSLAALLVEANGTTVAIPVEGIRRTVRLAPVDITDAAGRESVLCDGQEVPLLSLEEILGRSASDRRPSTLGRNARARSAVIVGSGSETAALGVDRLLSIRNVVVRPLPPLLAPLADEMSFVAGASLDAEGHPLLVLDCAGLVAAIRKKTASPADRTARLVERGPPILVIDDSLTTRMLEQSILESAGYVVELATSAEEALGLAHERPYGLFLVDVEMPGMDGVEFVTRTRADPVLREIPAILVTSLGAPEDRRRGLQAGAHAYIVKGEFDQKQLLDTIRGLIGLMG